MYKIEHIIFFKTVYLQIDNQGFGRVDAIQAEKRE